MNFEIDIDKLRSDLEDYYGTAMFSGFPMAVMDFNEVSRMTDRELVELAEKNHMDLGKYIVLTEL